MSKEKYFHRTPKTSGALVRHIQSAIDRAKRPTDEAVAKLQAWRKEPKEIHFAGTVEQQVLFFPDEIEEGGLVNGEMQGDIWLELVRKQNTVYSESVDFEDKRLKDD